MGQSYFHTRVIVRTNEVSAPSPDSSLSALIALITSHGRDMGSSAILANSSRFRPWVSTAEAAVWAFSQATRAAIW